MPIPYCEQEKKMYYERCHGKKRDGKRCTRSAGREGYKFCRTHLWQSKDPKMLEEATILRKEYEKTWERKYG